MKFHKGQPTIIYSYGCRVLEGEEIIDQQILLSHRYRNQLVALELDRRKQVNQLLVQLFPELSQIDERLAVAIHDREQLYEKLNALRAEKRKRVKAPPELQAAIKEAKAAVVTINKERKEARKVAYTSAKFKQAERDIENDWRAKAKLARKESKLHWGTYLAVERSAGSLRSGAPPTFTPLPVSDKLTHSLLTAANGGTPPTTSPTSIDGLVAVQIQNGLEPSKLLFQADRRLQDLGPREGFKNVRLLRVQLAKNTHVLLGVKFHRELPEDAMIKQIAIVRREIGTQRYWRLNFYMARESGWAKPDTADTGTVAVNLGWRLRPTGDPDAPAMRVLTWVDDTGASGEWLFPQKIFQDAQKVSDLAGIRDKNFDSILRRFSEWLKSAQNLPEWLTTATEFVAMWKSHARLDSLVRYWIRFDGDAEIYESLRAWRSQERHLRNWQAQLSYRNSRRRLDEYRVLAAQFRRRYRTLLIANVDWRSLHKKGPVDKADTTELARKRIAQVSPGMLDRCLRSTFAEVVGVAPENLTQTCAACGKLSGTMKPENLIHTCEQCGEVYDQDINHCNNLFNQALVAG